jgi:hypothetical protein
MNPVKNLRLSFVLLSRLAFVSGWACSTPPPEPKPPLAQPWETVFEGLPGALLSVTGTSADDVYAVGADGRDGKGGLFLHWDGKAWSRVATPAVDLWWVSRIGGTLFLAGSKGTVLTYAPSSGAVSKATTPAADVTLFGIWGPSEKDVWAVGGNLEGTGPKSALWHFDGTAWAAQKAPAPIEGKSAIFKVFGLAANEVFLCGAGGAWAQFDGAAWTAMATGVIQSLFTVHASKELTVAVGGFVDAVVVERVGTATPTKVSTPVTQRMNGVAVVSATEAMAVGNNGAVLRRRQTGWELAADQPTTLDLHSVYADTAGGYWAVGGDLAGAPLRKGTLVHFGKPIGKATLP